MGSQRGDNWSNMCLWLYYYDHFVPSKEIRISKPQLSAPPAPSAPTVAAHISASVFKATCLELMDDIAATGSEVIVTKHGRPVVRVGPANFSPASPVGFMRGTIVRHGDLVSSDHESWAASKSDPLLARVR